MLLPTAVQAAVSVTLFGLCLPAFWSQPVDHHHRNYTLPCCLLFLSCLWLFSAFATHAANGPLQLGRPGTGAALLLLGGAMLAIELTIRLIGAPHFGGTIASFDFGFKCTAGISVTDCERNQAFTPDFNSFGHCVQGCFSLLLLPAVERTTETKRAARNALRVASCMVAVYPIYNLLKRAARGASSFASSSFANNGAEWATGFLIGLSVGIAGQAIAAVGRRGDGVRFSGAPSADDSPPVAPRGEYYVDTAVRVLRLLAGGALCLASAVVAVLMGVSWDNSVAKPDRGDSVDEIILALMLAVPASGVIVWITYRSGRRAAHEMSETWNEMSRRRTQRRTQRRTTGRMVSKAAETTPAAVEEEQGGSHAPSSASAHERL